MNSQTSEQKAESLFAQMQPMVQQTISLGMTVRGIKAATLEQLTAHVALCDELSDKYHVTLDPVAMWGEDVHARALAKSRVRAGRHGAKALETKYGRNIAERIVFEKSGKLLR